MVAIPESEVIPSAVIHCCPKLLIDQGKCETIALPSKEVVGAHYFLILRVNPRKGISLCVPLYSDKDRIEMSNDWVKLDEDGKDGKAANWRGQDSRYFKWQFWRIPVRSFHAASTDDDSEPNFRRTYGGKDPCLLTDVWADLWQAQNPWRPLTGR